MAHARELIPEILDVEGAGIRYAINGLLSLTPDGLPVLGETPEVKNLWSVAAVWIKEGPGVGRAVAEWAVEGASEIDVHGSDVARFHPHQRDERHVVARTSEGFNKTYGIVHPAEQWASNRNVRVSPFHAREQELGAVFFETAGWERPWWYESNAVLLEEYGDRVMPREAEWDSRWWSPIVNAEHLAMRDRVAMIDLSAFHLLDVSGSGALDALQHIALAELDVEPGRVVYTPVLDHNGCFKADLTIMRLGPELFRIVTGAAHGMADRKWFSDRLPQDGSAQLTDVTEDWCTVGVWGPRARDLVDSVTSDDVSHAGFPFARCREVELGGVRALASRISYVGELGWELYAPMADGAALWDVLWEAGQPLGVVPAGIGVYGTTGRIEKGYRALRSRARSRAQRRRGGADAPDRQGARLRRQGRIPAPPRGRAGGDHVHADGRRPHLLVGRQAVHARRRADPDARRRADRRPQGASVVCHLRRVRPVGRQAPVAGLPAAGARRRGRAAARPVHGRALSGDGGRRGQPAALRSGEHPHPGLRASSEGRSRRA